MNAIAKAEPKAPATVTQHPASDTTALIQMIERVAMTPEIDINKMERLLEMQERIMARNAKNAFAADFAAMQPELPEIPERGKGHGSITYALWEDVNELVKPVLAKFGFGISFRTGREGDRVTVTAILTHKAGHSEETAMELAPDQSGSKNSVQAIGSSTSYGKRYTAAALLNLTSRGEDDDAKKTEITKSKSDARDIYAEMQGEIDACASIEELGMLWQSKPFQEELKTLPRDWKQGLLTRKEERKRDLSASLPPYVAPNFDAMEDAK